MPVPRSPGWCVPGAIVHGRNGKVGRVLTEPDADNRVTVEWAVDGQVRREVIDSRALTEADEDQMVGADSAEIGIAAYPEFSK